MNPFQPYSGFPFHSPNITSPNSILPPSFLPPKLQPSSFPSSLPFFHPSQPPTSLPPPSSIPFSTSSFPSSSPSPLPPSSSLLPLPSILPALLTQTSLLSEIEEGKLSKLKSQLASLSSSSNSSLHPISLLPILQLVSSLLATRRDFESLVGPYLGYLELKTSELRLLEGILTADRDFEGRFKDLKRNCLEILNFLKKSKREQIAESINEVIRRE